MNKNILNVGHKGLKTYFGCSFSNEKLIGNTAALLMIKKSNFNRVKGFIENNEECFEDVILNLNMFDYGLDNVFVGSAVAYHTESTSRKKDPKKTEKELRDYRQHLLPVIMKNIKKYKTYIK